MLRVVLLACLASCQGSDAQLKGGVSTPNLGYWNLTLQAAPVIDIVSLGNGYACAYKAKRDRPLNQMRNPQQQTLARWQNLVDQDADVYGPFSMTVLEKRLDRDLTADERSRALGGLLLTTGLVSGLAAGFGKAIAADETFVTKISEVASDVITKVSGEQTGIGQASQVTKMTENLKRYLQKGMSDPDKSVATIYQWLYASVDGVHQAAKKTKFWQISAIVSAATLIVGALLNLKKRETYSQDFKDTVLGPSGRELDMTSHRDFIALRKFAKLITSLPEVSAGLTCPDAAIVLQDFSKGDWQFYQF